MSLQHFKIKGNIVQPLVAISFINFILMLIVLIMSTTIFARPSGVQMVFPLFKESSLNSGHQVVITVTSENVIYLDDKVVTLNELRRFLAQGNFYKEVLTIKVDARASMGRVADIFDLCRGVAGASVNVTTIR